MKKVLFIGNFLSKSRMTIGPTEGVMNYLSNDCNVNSASNFNCRFLRLIDMTIKSLFLDYDLIHIEAYSTKYSQIFEYITSRIAKIRRKHIVFNLHGGGLWDLYVYNKRWLNKLFSVADDIVSPSLFLQREFSQVGYSIQYLPNAIDYQKFPFKEGRECNFKILWVRAFAPEYHPELAVKTLFEVRKTFENATLTMIGPDKGMLNEIEKLIHDLKLENNVFILGAIPNVQLFEYFHSHQVFINTTQYESFGIANLEAAACGIPIVSTNVGEIPYLWTNNINILLIDHFDEVEMSKSIKIFFEDEKISRMIANNAFENSKSFSQEVVKKQWIRILNLK